jgi:drug/metabolite transporter (DMT)-like permease
LPGALIARHHAGMADAALRSRATRGLILATACWGLSFPVMKSLFLLQEPALPGRSTFFVSALCLVYRFGLAALVMSAMTAHTLRKLTWNEVWHGLGVGVFGGVGIFFQMDALASTSASTSAFLTQTYCLILPWWVAARDRRWPSWQLLSGSVLVVTGIAVLSGMSVGELRMGRGELETILASVIFVGQILWLERPRFVECRTEHTTLVMFAATALVCLPVALATTREAGDWATAYSTPGSWVLLGLLVAVCTLGAFLLMTRWQRHVGAALAGLIYCCEPLFASFVALFVPGWISQSTGIAYPNEELTRNLLFGGGLILAANALAQWRPKG